MDSKSIRILIADDHPIVRDALKNLLAGNDLYTITEAECGDCVLKLLESATYDLLILDMSMPGQLSGPELIQTIIGERHSPPPILVFSMSDEYRLVSDALQAGASGYITKDNDPTMILTAIQKVAARGKYVSPKVAEKMLFNYLPKTDSAPQKLLSRREYQVFLKLLDGKPVDQIASELFISRQTVGTHKSRLMSKLGLNNNIDVIRYAIRHGLISL